MNDIKVAELNPEDLEAIKVPTAEADAQSWFDALVGLMSANPISVVANDYIVTALLLTVVLSIVAARASNDKIEQGSQGQASECQARAHRHRHCRSLLTPVEQKEPACCWQASIRTK